jgi:enoyl-[acyl-carrier protein] reductase I
MASTTPDWKAKEGLAAGKGATVQEFVATVGYKRLEIDVAPWGEGHLKVNRRKIAHVNDAKTGAKPFASSRRPLSTICRERNRSRTQKDLDHDSYRES